MLIAGTREKFPSWWKVGRFGGYDRCFGLGSKTFSLDSIDYSSLVKKAELWREGRRLGPLISIFVEVCNVLAGTLMTSLALSFS